MTPALPTPALLWLLAGVVTCGAEMLVPAGGYLLWIGVAASGAGLLAEISGWGLDGQVASFIALLGGVWLGWRLLQRPRPELVNAPDTEMLGRTCRAITFHGLEGRVRVGDGSWAARSVAGPEPTADALLQVVGRDGTTLLVAPAPGAALPSERVSA